MAQTPTATAPTIPFLTPTALGAAPWKVTTVLVEVRLPELEGVATLTELLLLIGYGGDEAAPVVDAGGAAAVLDSTGVVAGGGGGAAEEELPPGLRTESTLGTMTPASLQAKVA